MDKIMFVDKIPGPEEEGFVISVERHPGGSAPNTLVGLSRLGIRTGCIGRVGNDGEGEAMLLDLRQEGVETRGVLTRPGRSGTALSLVDEAGSRALIIDPGVNDEVEMSDIDIDYVDGFDLLHITSFVCRAKDTSFRTQISLLEAVETPVSLDPGQLYAEKGLRQLLPILKRCKIVLPNERELRMMTGLGPYRGAERLLKSGAEVVVVKMGAKGCFVTDGKVKERVDAYGGGQVVDTTGAGDAFNAGFIYGILKGLTLSESAEAGAKVAWFSIQKAGARSGLPSERELMALQDS